MKASA
jgi:hypothetical protein